MKGHRTDKGDLVIQHYKCRIENRAVRPFLLDGEPVSSFKAPATQKGKEKLYVIKNGSTFCYVGITSTPMAQRMRVGFNPQAGTGYYGYQWRNLQEIDMFVWATELAREEVEAIEAELVFTIKRRTGRWPEFQTEIHFHNPPGKQATECRGVAEALFRRLSKLKTGPKQST